MVKYEGMKTRMGMGMVLGVVMEVVMEVVYTQHEDRDVCGD